MNGTDFNPKGYISLMNERTVEYLLLPLLMAELKKQYETVIPFFFWATREGGYRNGEAFHGKDFKILGFYTRRPKISTNDDEHIVFKINQEIIEKANFLIPFGIPVITGTPMIRTLADIPGPSKVFWTNLSTKTGEEPQIDQSEKMHNSPLAH